MEMNKRIRAFTLAEVLITLAIIGVVAALTIPSVMSSYKDKQYNTARLKALKTFGDAGKMASVNGEINGQPTARAFVENVLSKYLKITKVCDNDKASECNFPSQIQPLDPSVGTIESNNLRAWNSLGGAATSKYWTAVSNVNLSVYIMTADGFSAKLFYNPKCARNAQEIEAYDTCTLKVCWHYDTDSSCTNIIYDMNGTKGPNHVGEDIGFVTTFWSGLNATAAAPGILPYSVNASAPKKSNPEAAAYCASKGTQRTPYSLPNIDEMSSIFMNKNLTSLAKTSANHYWSGSAVAEVPGHVWYVHEYGMNIPNSPDVRDRYAYCVRR